MKTDKTANIIYIRKSPDDNKTDIIGCYICGIREQASVMHYFKHGSKTPRPICPYCNSLTDYDNEIINRHDAHMERIYAQDCDDANGVE